MIYIYLYVHGGERFLLLLPSAAQSGHIEYKKGGRKARGWGELPAGSREPPAAPFTLLGGSQEHGAALVPRYRCRSVLGFTTQVRGVRRGPAG